MKFLGRPLQCFACFLLLILLIPGTISAQGNDILETGKTQRSAKTAAALTSIQVPLSPDFLPSDVSFTVETPDPDHFPTAMAKRIFAETVHGIGEVVNSERPPAVNLKLLLRLGESRNYVHTTFGSKQQGTQISMIKWNEMAFARLLARAVRNCLLSDEQMDEAAQLALRRAHMLVSAEELRSR